MTEMVMRKETVNRGERKRKREREEVRSGEKKKEREGEKEPWWGCNRRGKDLWTKRWTEGCEEQYNGGEE